MKKYILSIIIPIYNLEKYIGECLDTIIPQINNKTEIILVNDGSTDNSYNILKPYIDKYKNIKYFYQKNSGVSKARNLGLSKATGQYILFIDGDDWLIPNTLQDIYSKINENKYDIIAGGFEKSSTNSIKTRNNENISLIKKIESLQYPENIILTLRNNLYYPSLWANIYRREIFTKYNIKLNENLKHTEDLDCYLNLLINSKTIGITGKFYIYRQNRSGSATSKINKKRVEDNFNFVTYWYDKIKKINIDKRIKYEIIELIRYEYVLSMTFLFLLDDKDFNDLYKRIKDYKFLLQNSKNKRVRLVNLFNKVFGYDFTGKLLSKYIIKKR